MKIKYCLIITAIFSLILMTGCYTLLKHPTLQNDSRQSNSFGEVEPVQYRSDCIQCHVSSEDYYNSTLSYGHYYQQSSDRWLFYYDSPWWVQPFYYGGSSATEGSGQTVNPRKFGRRGVTNTDAAAQTSGSAAAASAAGASSVAAKKKDTAENNAVKPAVETENRRHARSDSGNKSKGSSSKRSRKKDN